MDEVIQFRVARMLEIIPADTEQEAGYILDRSSVYQSTLLLFIMEMSYCARVLLLTNIVVSGCIIKVCKKRKEGV